ncbi:MAG: CvpA family protein [Ferruginibacter sp.]
MIIDILFLLCILLAIVKGYSKGFIVALFSVVGFIVGLAAAIKLSAYVASNLSEYLPNTGKWLPVISFLVVFIGVVILVNVGAKLIQKSIELVMLGWANRIAGILLYVLLYSIFISVFLFYAVQLHILTLETVAASFVYPYIQTLAPTVIDGVAKVIPLFKDMFSQLEQFFGTLPPAKVTPAFTLSNGVIH